MKIEYSYGCTVDNIAKIDSNGLANSGFTQEDISYILEYIREEYENGYITLTQILDIITPSEEHYDTNICEQCGDSVTTITWEF